jgi:Pyridoxal-dependent decarboxylase, pyridoxal binding domain
VSAHSLENLWSLPEDILAWFERGAAFDAKPLALIDETVALRRCVLYRKAFKGIAVSYPAALLKFDALSAWIRRERVTVDVTSAGELDRAMAAGIDPTRIVMHPQGGAVAPIRGAVIAGAARFVVGSSQQVAILADSTERNQRVVIDATDGSACRLAAEVVVHRGLDLIGLHCKLDDPDEVIGAVKLQAMIAEMSWIRHEHSILLTRISVDGVHIAERCLAPRILRGVAEAIGEVVGDACARHRYPRPALTLSPSRVALLPA